jgi:hypothetical protein
MKDFNGKTEKRRPLLHLIDHEVYKMVTNVHVILDKKKMIDKNIKKDDM